MKKGRKDMVTKAGMVYLIGAGPGDPGLLTLKGKEALERADTIVYDYLANESLMSHAGPESERIYVGKRDGKHTLSQEEINRLLIEKALEGKVVARLKGGDPFIFGRGGEEADALSAHGIPFEVIPGITSAIAAASYAGIPLTHRRYASSVAFITGHEDAAKSSSCIDWAKISTGPQTLVFFMAVKNLRRIVERLLEHGKAPETPSALVRWGTTWRQKTIASPLGNIVEEAEKSHIRAPSILVVGEVVALRERLNWFERKPLFGRRILVTRAMEQASALVKLIRMHGAEPIALPTIRIEPPESWEALDRAIDTMAEYDWVIFTSANGFSWLMKRMHERGKDIRDLKGPRICAIGSKTAEVIKNAGIKVDMVPDEYRAEGILEMFEDRQVQGKRFLLPRAQKAREVLPEELRSRGALVDVVAAYKTGRPELQRERLLELLHQGGIDVVTFTSSSTVTNFVEILKGEDLGRLLQGVTVACIGPITAEKAHRLGIKTDVMPDVYTVDGLVDALVRYFGDRIS